MEVIRGSNVKRKVWIHKTVNPPWEGIDKIIFWTSNTLQEHVAVDDPGFCIIIKHFPLDRMAAQQTVCPS